jgi:hypothetical protein
MLVQVPESLLPVKRLQDSSSRTLPAILRQRAIQRRRTVENYSPATSYHSFGFADFSDILIASFGSSLIALHPLVRIQPQR